MANYGSFSLVGKTAVVTGGASGIGLAISELYAKKGANVFILDLNLDDATKAAASINAQGGKCTGLACNVASLEDVEAAFGKVGGVPDIVVNNAGIAAVGTVLECTSDDMDRLYQVNIKGVFHVLKTAVKAMTGAKKQGSIINLASIASKFGLRERFAYSMSKGAVLTMTYAVATDHVQNGIRCNCIAPTRIHTPFVEGYLNKSFPNDPAGKAAKFKELSAYQPMARMGVPKDVAAMALFLAAEESAFCTGQCYSVDGGVENCWDAVRPKL
jgi:NAD(P)-dependent dehydrogenase (short-subunit alcohol dehydrogenase family)